MSFFFFICIYSLRDPHHFPHTPTMDKFTKELLILFLNPSTDSPFQLYAAFPTEQLELMLQYVPNVLMQST